MPDKKRVLKILARATDHLWGENGEQPTVPTLNKQDALMAFLLRLFLVILNVLTCFFVFANVIRHW